MTPLHRRHLVSIIDARERLIEPGGALIPRSETMWGALAEAPSAYGICLWFDSELADGVRFSNAPDAPELIYGSALFAFTTPVAVEEGDAIHVHLEARLFEDDYVWRWRTRILDSRDPSIVRAAFDQSTLAGVPLSSDKLRKARATFVPTLTSDGEIDRMALELMGTGESLADIAEQLAARFLDRFPSPGDALRRAARLSQKYSR